MSDAITAREAADIIEILPRSVLRLIEKKVLAGRKSGGIWLLDRAEVEAYAAAVAAMKPNDPRRGAATAMK